METFPELSERMWVKRLGLEYDLLREHEPNFGTVNGDLTHYGGVIIPESGLYEGGYFRVEIIVPRAFPYVPPEIIWHTRIWHPNFSDDIPARVCDQLLKEKWQPKINLFTITETLRSLLNEPNPEDPLNTIAATEMTSRPDIFERRARYYVEQFATAEQAFHDIPVRQE